jgi:hypothetical protein
LLSSGDLPGCLRANVQDTLDDREGGAERDDRERALDDEDAGGDGRGTAVPEAASGDPLVHAQQRTQDEPAAQDHEPDFPGHDPDCCHAGPGGEAEAFGLGPDVADQERAGHRRASERGAVRPAAGVEAGDEPHIDERFAPPIEYAVHERPEAADAARRPGERAIEHVEDAAGEDDDSAGQPELAGQQDGPDRGDPEPDEGQAGRRQAQPAQGERQRLPELLDPVPRLVGDHHVASSARDRRSVAEHVALTGCHLVEGPRTKGADRLAPCPPGHDESSVAQALEVMAHERLGKSDVVDQLGHRGGGLGQAPDDPEPIHVRERPVERAQLAQVVRLVDDRGKSPADPGWRRGQEKAPRAGSRRVRRPSSLQHAFI